MSIFINQKYKNEKIKFDSPCLTAIEGFSQETWKEIKGKTITTTEKGTEEAVLPINVIARKLLLCQMMQESFL